MLGNGVIGILSESSNIWERRAPLTPAHCARLLHSGKGKNGIQKIIVQPSTKRIYHDVQYEDVGCEISDDLSECGLILGVKQPKLEMILPDRAYAFFSHTHKAQKENMPLLDKILAQRDTLYDYELIVGDNGKRLLAFGKFAGRAGLIDFLHGLGKRYLSLGYSTPFLTLGASHMYPSLAAAKAAVIAVGEEIAAQGLPPGLSPIVFVFVGSGNVSQGAQEIFKLLPHTFVDVSKLPEIVKQVGDLAHHSPLRKRVFKVYGCIVTSQDFVEPKDPTQCFDKVDYYAHPDHYNPVFHKRIAPYASVIVNCMYWENRFLRLLTTQQMQELAKKGCPLVGISDITCDIGGSIEFVNQCTTIEKPFFRYNPFADSYHDDMDGDGLVCLAVENLPTEFSRESTKHFGDILSQFVGSLAWAKNLRELPSHLQRACITHGGALTPLYEYIPRMRNSSTVDLITETANGSSGKRKYSTLVSLSGHLFDQLLINEALDIVEAAGGSFCMVKCEVGQSSDAMSYSELEISADDMTILDQICDALSLLANPSHKDSGTSIKDKELSLTVNKVSERMGREIDGSIKRPAVLILGAGRVCQPAAELLASAGDLYSNSFKRFENDDAQVDKEFEVIVASLYQKDAEETIEGIPNAKAVQLDVMDDESLSMCISQVEIVLSLLPPSFHTRIAKCCIEHEKHLVTASYVDNSMSAYHEKAKDAGVTILCEMGLDPGIDHMMAMRMINQAHVRKGKIRSFTSYCGGLPSPAAANNPLAYKFRYCLKADLDIQRQFSFGKYYLVDVGYPLKTGYLKPYPETRYHLADFARGSRPVHGRHEHFNKAHSSLRSVIEQTFGVWKKKWHILQKMPQYNFKKQRSIVLATMALHNFIRRHPSRWDPEFNACDADDSFIPPEDDDHTTEDDMETDMFDDGGSDYMSAVRDSIAEEVYNTRSWSPAGAIRAGRNPACYKYLGNVINVDGQALYDSAVSFRFQDLPAFALEYLPNRNSLVFGDLYGISDEASTIFRATLRYEGFSAIMSCLGKLGFFDQSVHPKLKGLQRPTFRAFLKELLKVGSEYPEDYEDLQGSFNDKEFIEMAVMNRYCRDSAAATKAAKTIKFLGLHEDEEIPEECSSAFDVVCLRMQQRLNYSGKEQDMVLLHHEIQVEFPDGRPMETHKATLLEFGKTENGRSTTAMALTVGIPAAIGTLLLLQNKIQSKGVIRPTEPEVYVPALELLEAYEIKLMEKIEIS